MTKKSKKEQRQLLLKALQAWHKNLGIVDFPNKFGISTNEKKFREISFRVKRGKEEHDATVDDIVVSKQESYGLNHTLVAHSIMYRVWLPTAEGKFPGYLTIRFSLHSGLVALVKVGKYFIAVEHFNFPLQKKAIGMPRMFGITESEEVDTLANMLLAKEYPFMLDHVKEIKASQLGKSVYIDPSARKERTATLLIELDLLREVNSKEDLAEYIDHRNKEMLLHRIFTENELKQIYKEHVLIGSNNKLIHADNASFIDNYSLWALALYFAKKL